MSYVITFLAVALFPLALAAYGGHLAASVLNGNARSKALWTVWILAAGGVILSGLQQFNAYRSDMESEKKQAALQAKLQTSLLDAEYMKGQLNSLSVMVGKIGDSRSDPEVKRMAKAIEKIAEQATNPRTSDLSHRSAASISFTENDWRKVVNGLGYQIKWTHQLSTHTPHVTCYDSRRSVVDLGVSAPDQNTILLSVGAPISGNCEVQ